MLFCTLVSQWGQTGLGSRLEHAPFKLSRVSSVVCSFFFALVFLLLAAAGLLRCWFLERTHHVLFEGLLLEYEAVLVPNEVWSLGVEVVAVHAIIEQVQDVTVVGVICELQGSAVLHELFELNGLVQAQLVDGDLLLLSFNVVIFFVLGTAGEALPRERSSQEVEEHVTDGLQVVTTRLFIAQMGI